VTCLDCHVNGHTSGQFHINPDTRPEQRRMRLDTVSLRGLFKQQIHGSKRSLRSVEDFTEFEQRTAYFNGDEIHAIKKGMNILDRIQVSHMAQMQNMFDFPPAPKLTALGRLDSEKATESERRGETLFFGKAQCAACHPAPFYLDHQMHDLPADRVAVALTEALVNAIQHGNLELDSRLRREDEASYDRMAEFRRRRPPYRDRQLHVRARLTRREAVYVIRDEGPGFDPSTLPDPTDPAHLEKTTGRGLLLIRAYMDEVTFNGAGNQITLTKRRMTPPNAHDM
jgi:anti-sigma regulatory factor (Ser/Thr protein kinase)